MNCCDMDPDTNVAFTNDCIYNKKIKIHNDLSCYIMTHSLLMTAEHTNVMITDHVSETIEQLNEELRLSKDEAQKTQGNLYIHVSFPLMKGLTNMI